MGLRLRAERTYSERVDTRLSRHTVLYGEELCGKYRARPLHETCITGQSGRVMGYVTLWRSVSCIVHNVWVHAPTVACRWVCAIWARLNVQPSETRKTERMRMRKRERKKKTDSILTSAANVRTPDVDGKIFLSLRYTRDGTYIYVVVCMPLNIFTRVSCTFSTNICRWLFFFFLIFSFFVVDVFVFFFVFFSSFGLQRIQSWTGARFLVDELWLYNKMCMRTVVDTLNTVRILNTIECCSENNARINGSYMVFILHVTQGNIVDDEQRIERMEWSANQHIYRSTH